MHTPTLLASGLSLLSLAIALPLESRATYEFDITALSASLPVDGVYGTGPRDSPISITVTYPDASSSDDSTLSTTCNYVWPSGTSPGPTDWTPCDNADLQWRLPANGWTSRTNYRVEVYQTLTDSG